jgi:hypothetical protein
MSRTKTIIEGLIAFFIEEYGSDTIRYRIDIDNMHQFFRGFIGQIVTQARKGTEKTLKKIEGEFPKYGGEWSPVFFISPQGEELLKKYVGHNKKIEKIVTNARTMNLIGIKDWIKELHTKSHKGKYLLGRKSTNAFLKSCEFYDHYPIDRYYPPFLTRTGILRDYIIKNKEDPGKYVRGLNDQKCYDAFEKMMLDLCKIELKEVTYYGFELSKKPGLVDMFIWDFCSDPPEGHDICGNVPKCSKCIIKGNCDYGLLRC